MAMDDLRGMLGLVMSMRQFQRQQEDDAYQTKARQMAEEDRQRSHAHQDMTRRGAIMDDIAKAEQLINTAKEAGVTNRIALMNAKASKEEIDHVMGIFDQDLEALKQRAWSRIATTYGDDAFTDSKITGPALAVFGPRVVGTAGPEYDPGAGDTTAAGILSRFPGVAEAAGVAPSGGGPAAPAPTPTAAAIDRAAPSHASPYSAPRADDRLYLGGSRESIFENDRGDITGTDPLYLKMQPSWTTVEVEDPQMSALRKIMEYRTPSLPDPGPSPDADFDRLSLMEEMRRLNARGDSTSVLGTYMRRKARRQKQDAARRIERQRRQADETPR